MSYKKTLAVDDHHFHGNRSIMKFFLGLITGKLSDPVSKLDSGIACQFQHFRGGVGLSTCFQDVSGSAQRFQLAGKPLEST